jgi:HEPN domain-containing protein
MNDEIDRHSPIGFYNFAGSYHTAADLICEHGLYATHPEGPATFLYCHAIELYLKSFLRFHGTSAKKLQSIGHDYRRLLSRASKRGLVLEAMEDEVLNIIDGEIWSRSRYLETGFRSGRPSLDELSTASRTLRRQIGKVLSDAGMTVRKPGHKRVTKGRGEWR